MIDDVRVTCDLTSVTELCDCVHILPRLRCSRSEAVPECMTKGNVTELSSIPYERSSLAMVLGSTDLDDCAQIDFKRVRFPP